MYEIFWENKYASAMRTCYTLDHFGDRESLRAYVKQLREKENPPEKFFLLENGIKVDLEATLNPPVAAKKPRKKKSK